ncbi:MAG: 7-carboxy-7-deazaguanine synthase QueE [SAR202 cluster bacterium]|nr:7-carboxy-7-deazaguanine synthase QueE [SAR202 cluster bacterium]
MLRVSRKPSGGPEIFHSIQGEGASMGLPAVFMRLAMCNLACTWCDTRYTWDFDAFDFDKEVMTIGRDEAAERILAYKCDRLVITGGEPLLQQKELWPLAADMKARGVMCEVETNGTLAPSAEMVGAVAQWNVSPKLASSGNRRERAIVPKAIQSFLETGRAYFKFVVVTPADMEEVCGLAKELGIPADRLILMPEGTSAAVLVERGRRLAEECARRGFRFSTRLHIMLWGDERGR